MQGLGRLGLGVQGGPAPLAARIPHPGPLSFGEKGAFRSCRLSGRGPAARNNQHLRLTAADEGWSSGPGLHPSRTEPALQTPLASWGLPSSTAHPAGGAEVAQGGLCPLEPPSRCL